MSIRKVRQLVWLGALCISVQAGARAQTGGWVPVSPEQVASAMRAAGVDTNADRIQMLASVTTAPGATLRVAKKVEESPNTMLAELACRVRRQCLPFYVLIHVDPVASAVAKPAGSRQIPASAVSSFEEHPLVARGQPVTLIIENATSRIVLPAICLQAGVHGQAIRVASPDRKRTYRAEVINEKTVRSTL